MTTINSAKMKLNYFGDIGDSQKYTGFSLQLLQSLIQWSSGLVEALYEANEQGFPTLDSDTAGWYRIFWISSALIITLHTTLSDGAVYPDPPGIIFSRAVHEVTGSYNGGGLASEYTLVMCKLCL